MLALVFAVIPLGGAAGDSVSDKKAQAEQVKSQLQANQSELNRLTAALSQTESQLASVEASIDRNQAELEVAEAELARYQGILNERVRAMYMEGNSSALEVMLGSSTFDDFINSYDYMRIIGDYDSDMVNSTRNLMGEIQDKRAGLESSRAQYESQAASQAQQRGAIQAKLSEQQAILNGLDAELASMVAQQTARSPGGGGGGFSSARSTASTSRWPALTASPTIGAPRAAGGRPQGDRHHGQLRGALRRHHQRQRGAALGRHRRQLRLPLRRQRPPLLLHAPAELWGHGARSARNRHRHVGDTGNARGCPHLHFEYHPGGGGPVNPYPLLIAID